MSRSLLREVALFHLVLIALVSCGPAPPSTPVAKLPTPTPTAESAAALEPTVPPPMPPTHTSEPTEPPPTTSPTSTSTPTLTSTPTSTHTATPSATPLPKDVPPVVVIDAPLEARVGDEIVLDASETFDWDGDAIQFSWVQFHNPDRYTGTEYVTGNDTVISTIDGQQEAKYPDSLAGPSMVKFVPEWPGNYRFTLSAQDDDGVSEKSVDVLVHLGDSPFSIAGIGTGPHWRPNESINVASITFDRIANTNAEWAEFQVVYYVDDIHSTEVKRCPSSWHNGSPCLTPSNEQLVAIIQKAHEKGLSFFLDTFITCPDWTCEPYQFQSTDINSLFDSYATQLKELARIAEENNVEMMAVGIELYSTHRLHNEWRKLVNEVSEIYSGKLVYGGLPMWGPIPDEFPAWDLMDYIGVNFYIRGSDMPPNGLAHPSVAEMYDYMQNVIGPEYESDVLPLVDKYGKPVIIYQTGCQNFDGVNQFPIDWQLGGQKDNQEQADWFEALFRLLYQKKWVDGIFVNGMAINASHDDYLGREIHFDIRERPAEEVVALWYE